MVHFFVVIVLSIAIALSILYLSAKLITVLLFVPFIFIFWHTSSFISKIAITVGVLTFPITLRFLGRDAITTGTLLIIFIFFWHWAIHKNRQEYSENTKYIFKIITILVLISIVGMATKTPTGYYGPAIRHLLDFISSVLIFITIIKESDMLGTANSLENYIEKIISILILICSLHILLSLFLYYSPNYQYIFKIFFHRTQTHLGTHISKTGGFERAASVFVGGEELGELLIVLSPFFFYKAFKNNKFILLLPILFIGLIISGTRSAAILVIIELVAFFIMTRSEKMLVKKIVIVAVGLFFLTIGWDFISSILGILLNRFQESAAELNRNAAFATIMNRGPIWNAAWDTTWRTLSFIGHGPSQASALGMNRIKANFHCLYLTLIFQFGIIGFFIFMRFFYYLLKNLLSNLYQTQKNNAVYPLILANTLSLSSFLINEGKFEFNRGDSYQQFIFVVFAIYFMTGQITEKKNITR